MKPNLLTKSLLAWYKKSGRDLPWRVKGKAHFNPYYVWISEIMLQQTTVQSVIPYFERWIARFPTLESLALSSIDDVLFQWQGLGYYTRAKNIYKSAQLFYKLGYIPDTKEELIKYPGIGPYTSSSICAFAFNKPEVVIDGNVIRVIARLYGIKEEATYNLIFPYALEMTSKNEGADYASAIMDFGAVVCKPSSPLCEECPLKIYCKAFKHGWVNEIPVIKKIKKEKRKASVFLIFNEKKEIYIQKRKETGLLEGLYEFPWYYGGEEDKDILDRNWESINKNIKHVFTHFDLTINIKKGCFDKDAIQRMKLSKGIFVPLNKLIQYPFSTLMKKIIKII